MKKFNEFLNEAVAKEDDAYKDIKYKIGDKVFVRTYNGVIWTGEIFNRTMHQGYTYCIKFDKKYPGGNNGQFAQSEFPKKYDTDGNSYWMADNQALIFKPEDGTEEEGKYEYVYLKDFFGKDKARKKCDNPTQKKAKHTWNCKLCKGTGYIIQPMNKEDFRDILKDKEFIYQEYKKIEGFKPFYYDTTQYWCEWDEITQIGARAQYARGGAVEQIGGRVGIYNTTFNEEGRFKLRPKPKKEEDPHKDNWWFMNSEKKPIKKKGE